MVIESARVAAEWAPDSARVLVCLLGSFRIIKDGSSLTLRPGGKVEQLMASLVLRGRYGVPREELLEEIWPSSDIGQARQSLNSLAYWLHRRLGDALDGRPPIVRRDGHYLLNTDVGIAVDVVEFEAAVEAGARLDEAGDIQGAIESYNGAVGFYAGDLAAGTDIHQLLERERLRARYLSTLAKLSDRYFAMGDYRRSLQYALELLGTDPCREDAHRIAMRCFVRFGERAQALRQYQVCRRVLEMEFQAPPEEATEALFELVRSHPNRV
jgi:DNA-binding SARP family transcriptional activator